MFNVQCSMLFDRLRQAVELLRGLASRGRIGLEGTVAIPKELKWTVKGLSSRVKLSGIASQLLVVGTIRRPTRPIRKPTCTSRNRVGKALHKSKQESVFDANL